MSVRVRDLDRTKLFVYQLHELRSRMVIAADPLASDLDRIIGRFVDGGDDDRADDGHVRVQS